MPIFIVKLLLLTISCLVIAGTCATGLFGQESQQTKPQPSTERIPWTTSQIQGSPEPPVPFVTERVFEDVALEFPTEMIRLPDSDRWVVVQMDGKIFSFSKSVNRDLKTVVDLKKSLPSFFRGYGIVFHPEFPAQPYCYIAFSAEPKSQTGSRLSRFKVTDTSVPLIDPDSETVLLEWSSVDHCGGSLHFGPDGYLYFSIGDGQQPAPPDPAGTGQDISDLQSSILRIDVDQTSGDLPYRIPDDNPFVNVPGARGEVWAFGVRNPWKIAFHPTNGELWAADVGWEMLEMIYRIDRGANYGWSVMEGSQLVKLNGVRHEIPITPPLTEYDHTQGRSVTGGYFWQSDRYPQLKDAYLYGDFTSGKIWTLKAADATDANPQPKEIANSWQMIICFALDSDGEILVVGFDGTIHRLIPNPMVAKQTDQQNSFPQRLSETGLFASVVNQTPAPGVIPYSINAHHWADHTTSEQWFGLVGDSKLGIHERGTYNRGQVAGFFSFPQDAVFAKTVSYLTDVDESKSARRLETQVLHRLDTDWRAYNYIWNDEQTDAFLQDNVAITRQLTIKDSRAPEGIRKQSWLHASRDQCMLCHIWRAGSVNGFKVDQLNRTHGTESINQLEKLENFGLTSVDLPRDEPAVSPSDDSAPLDKRARRYLDLNCGHCHMAGGGGSSQFNLRAGVSEKQLNLIGVEALQGDFGMQDCKVVAPGDPAASVLLYRLAKSGPGQMPKFGNNVVDEAGVKLIRDWILAMKSDHESNSSDADEVNELLMLPIDATDFDQQLDRLLESTGAALLLSIRCAEPKFDLEERDRIVERAMNHSNAHARDLFERFLPEEKRIKRLGPNIDGESLLAINGDIERGSNLFFGDTFTCKNCHQINGVGKMVGPDLSSIGNLRTPAQLLKSLLEPSAEIEPAYQGHLVLTIDGEIKTGLLAVKQPEGSGNTESDPADSDSVTLIDLEGKRITLAADDIEEMRPLQKSIMPERLLAEFTAQQAADLLAFLSSLKSAAKK